MTTQKPTRQTQMAGLAEAPAAIRRLFEGVETANWDGTEPYLAPDVFYDASVPEWRYQLQGRDSLLDEMRTTWTGRNTWQLAEVHLMTAQDECIVEFEAYEYRSDGPGQLARKLVTREVLIFRLAGERITELRLYCCGEWDEETMRRIEAEAPKVVRGV